ncbi:MAG: hypothetical protein ACI88G_000802 [Woeseiaceae bacterium]|jgi:hypothetical protein
MRIFFQALFLRSIILAIMFAPLALQAAPKSPAEMFGFNPGDDYKLASYEQMEAYYRQLAAESDRVELREIGESSLGRPLLLLTISSPENLANQDRYKSISEQLARARVDSETADQLALEGKAVVWIDGGLHATEVAHAQMTSSLAHRVATEESNEMQLIRENVIFLLMPVMNPDGLEIVRKWYESQLGTRFEHAGPPELYHHYVGHDNNRDFFMNNMPESKAVAKVIYNEWYPQIIYNQHQTSPGYARIVIPPFSDPVNPLIHPGVTTGLNEVGSAMGNRFALEKMPGAIADVGFSMWWNGGMRTVPYFHNMIGILTETGHDSASPRIYDPKNFPKTIALRANPGAPGMDVAEEVTGVPDARVLYPYPYAGGESHFSEPVNYMITGSIAVLRAASDSRVKWLTNIHRMGQDSIANGESGTRYYVIPGDQRHSDEARNMVNVLIEGGIEVDRAESSFSVDGTRYAEGSYVINAAQAFRPYIVDLLEKQAYPDTRLDPTGAIRPPYDIAGWTLPMQMAVEVDFIGSEVDADLARIQGLVEISAGSVSGGARYGYALSHAMNSSVKAVNSLLADGEMVYWTNEASRAGRSDLDAGTFIIESGDNTEARVEALAARFGVDFVGLGSEPTDNMSRLRLPRVGMYKSYVAFMDEGWSRWLLEEYGFAPTSLSDNDIRSGDLSAYDAIVLPHTDGRAAFKNDVQKILTGHAPGSMPDEFTGGLGLQGASALQQFVMNGGTIVTFGAASNFAIEQFGLPIRNLLAGASRANFSIPGSLLGATVDNTHPLAYGMPANASLNFVNGGAFDVLGQSGCTDDLLNLRHCSEVTRGWRPLHESEPVSRYESIVNFTTDAETVLMSGWAHGTEHIAGKSAMAQVPQGEGSVVLFAFRPQFRGQPRGTYKLVFNALHGATVD